MAIQFPRGFLVTTDEPIDIKLVLTKSQMAKAEELFMMPSPYFCLCSDDNKIYIYDVKNEIVEDSNDEFYGLGHFRPADDELKGLIANEAERAAIAEDNLNKSIKSEADERLAKDTELAALLTTETSNRTTADEELDSKISTLEETTNTKIGQEIKDRQNEITRVEDLITEEATTRDTNDKVILDKLEDTATTLNTKVEKEIQDRTNADKVLEGKIEDEADTRENVDKEILAKIGGSFTSENTVAKAISDTQAAAEAKVTALENGQVTINKNDIATIKTDIITAKTELQGYADGKASEVQGNLNTHISDYNTKVQALDGKITTAQNAANKAQEEVDALETVVNNLSGTVSSNDTAVRGLISNEATARDNADKAIKATIGTVAEGKTVVGLIGEAKTELQGYAETKANAVQTNLTNHINSTYIPKVQELVNEDARIAGLVSTEEQARKDAIDTVNSEIGRVEGLISTEKSRAEGIEAGLKTDITNIQNNIASGLHFRGIKEALSDITDPTNGDIIIIGTQEYIYAEGEWEEFGNAEAHATRDELTSGLNLKVNKTTYDTKIAALEAEDTDIRADFATADSNLKSELEGKINSKAAQDDFNNLSNTVSGLSSSKLDKSVYDVHIEAYTGKVSSLEAKDAGQDAKIKSIEDSLKPEGDTYKAIAAAKEQADKGVEDAKAAQDDINELDNRVVELEKVDHTHSNKDILDNTTASFTTELKTKLDNVEDQLEYTTEADIEALFPAIEPPVGEPTLKVGNVLVTESQLERLIMFLDTVEVVEE